MLKSAILKSYSGKNKNASLLGIKSPSYNFYSEEWEGTNVLSEMINRRSTEKYSAFSFQNQYSLVDEKKLFNTSGLNVAEPPVIWVIDDSHSHNIVRFANDFRYIIGDNWFDVFAHANHKYIEGRDKNGKIVAIRTAKKFVELMKITNSAFRGAFERGALITIKLHACNTGADTDHKGNSIINPIGQQISEKYHNIIVIAPDGKVVTAYGKDPNGKDESSGYAYEKGVWDNYDSTPNPDGSQGSYRMFFKGKVIYEDSSVGLKPPPKK